MATTTPAVFEEDAPVETASLRGIGLDEFLALPEATPALEYEEGEVRQKVAPQVHHSRLQYYLCLLINKAAEPQKIAIAFPELRTTGRRRSYVPDVAVYVWDRLPRSATGELATRATQLPDMVAEIASPEQRVTGLVRKCLWFIENGARIALLIDPEDRTVMVFRPSGSPSALRGTEEIELSEIIPDFRLSVAALFASLRVG